MCGVYIVLSTACCIVWSASRWSETKRGIRLPLLCDIRTMGKPNAGKQMARAGMRCTLCVLSLAMIVLPIIDGERLKMEASASGKSTIPVKTAMPDMSVMCAGLLLPWSGGKILTEIAEFFRSIGIVP